MSAKPAKPVFFQGDLKNLPAALGPLKELPNWVCWRWEWKLNKRGIGKWDKPPYQSARPQSFARNNDRDTWGSYEQALAAFEGGHCDGIGFNLSGTEFGAFDIDNCRDPETGMIASEGMDIVKRAASYTEMTISGTGLRVIGRGNGPKLHRRQRIPGCEVEVETYRSAERYIVITGNPLPQTQQNISTIDATLDAVVAELDAVGTGGGVETADRQTTKSAFLPADLTNLIQHGVPSDQDLSAVFHHVVCWLHDLGYGPRQIEGLVVGKPIVPARFSNRLAGEILRCLQKAKPHQDYSSRHEQTGRDQPGPRPAIELLWHGEMQNRLKRTWLIKDLIPEKGQGLASGQWGAAKTFAMIDLAASIMTAVPFAGRETARQGGVLFIAAEGASEIPIRLQAVVDHKLRGETLAIAAGGRAISVDLDKLPFAWIEESPSLKDDIDRITEAALAAVRQIGEGFNLPLALIVVDTLNAAANFKDGNDSAEGQMIMNRLNALSMATGAFVLAVDHFGKAVETGTRGTSAKEAAADVVLALLADRDIAGNISNTRMAVRKLRGGSTGKETPFNLKVVDAVEGETTCIIEWKEGIDLRSQKTSRKERWTRSLRVFRAAMATALADHGEAMRPFGSEGPEVKAVADTDVRTEFMARYVADADNAKDKTGSKRKAYQRSLAGALERNLIAARELQGIDRMWFVEDQDTSPTRDGRDTP